MTTMITLIGAQPQQNIIPILHYKPNSVVLVYTAETRKKYENLKIELETRDYHIHGIEADPYNADALTKALNELLATIAESPQSMIFNVTGGTKIMTLAAYQVAAHYNASVIYLQHEKRENIIDLYGWQDHQLCWQGREAVNQYLSLHDILNLHLRQGIHDIHDEVYTAKNIDDLIDEEHAFKRAIVQVLADHDYEVMCGVSDARHWIDIDIMIRYRNQIGILGVKSSRVPIGLDIVRQLNTAMYYLSGTYIRPFLLVINGQARYELRAICDILHIPLIASPDYSQGATSLSEWDRRILLTEIDRTMKGEIYEP